MAAHRDLIFLKRVLDILDQDEQSPQAVIEQLYPLVYNRIDQPIQLASAEEWDSPSLARAVKFIKFIVCKYVQLFQDPRDLPVTHSLRQKKVAIHLDHQFAPILRESVVRSSPEKLREDNGAPMRDDFLDEPILYLKQEARSKMFPKTKSRGVKLGALEERFDDKLLVKGTNLNLLSSDGFNY